MRENPDDINGLNLAEIKQMAFQQQDKRLKNGVADSFANEMEKCINVLDFSELSPLPDSNGQLNQESILEMQAGEDSFMWNSTKRQMNDHTCKCRQFLIKNNLNSNFEVSLVDSVLFFIHNIVLTFRIWQMKC